MVTKGRSPHILTAAVEELWASLAIDGKQSTPPEIHRQAITRFGEKSISLRTVQSIVRDLEPQTFEEAPDDSDWLPWEGPESPEDTALLMELDLQSKIWLERSLSQLEAVWAVRIAPSITELGWFTHWTLARQYAHREKLASLMGSEQQPNEFLNMLLAIKPWESGRHELWTTAVQVGLSEWYQKIFYDIAPFDARPDLTEAVYRDLNLTVDEWSVRAPFDDDWTLRELQSHREVDEEESVILQFDPEIDFERDVGTGTGVEPVLEFEVEDDDDIAAGEFIEFEPEPESELALVDGEADEVDDESAESESEDILEFELEPSAEPEAGDDEVSGGDGVELEIDADEVPASDGGESVDAVEDDDAYDPRTDESLEELRARIDRFLGDDEAE